MSVNRLNMSQSFSNINMVTSPVGGHLDSLTPRRYDKSDDSMNPFNLSNDKVKKMKEFQTIGILE